ncbi:MAG: dihydroorotase [Lachnospiraceae bacterium]
MKLLIKNGRILDPATATDAVMHLLIEDDKIVGRYEQLDNMVADKEIDAAGCYVMPGLIDMHVHLREPGFEYKETIRTGALAAAHGGYTTICPMPNTKPATDSPSMIEYIRDKAENDAVIHVLPVGAVTLGQNGEKLTDIAGMAKAGAVGISEDGKSVMNAALYREGMKEAAKAGIIVMAHCEDKNLVGKGCLNLGPKSEELGVPGISNSVEDVITARDIILAKETGVHLHLCHCSTKDSVSMVKAAKEDGVAVTAEVCPHHFSMSEEDITSDDSNFKMNPPLRSKEDVQALKEGLRDGIMEVISTDHAPHHASEKAKSVTEAPFGIVGSETAVALTITNLVDAGYLTPMQMAEKMSYNPARILGINRGSLEIGKPADVVVIDPNAEYCIDVNTFYSKGKNTPFNGMKVHGRVLCTICDGQIVYQYEGNDFCD